MRRKTLKKAVLCAFFLALGLTLPFLTGQIRSVGNMLLPMHIPVFLCGLICGGPWGAAVGFILPLFRSALFGMPPLYPEAVSMAFELAVYAGASGLLYGRVFRRRMGGLYASLIAAMVAGRLVWGAVKALLLGFGGKAFTLQMFVAGAFINALPGIAVQLILIPGVMTALHLVEKKTPIKSANGR
ncbi:MAG: ECF transporter S component [Clostridia bacterium]|nr:ECF transporter S component [Clostridia bacterium]